MSGVLIKHAGKRQKDKQKCACLLLNLRYLLPSTKDSCVEASLPKRPGAQANQTQKSRAGEVDMTPARLAAEEENCLKQDECDLTYSVNKEKEAWKACLLSRDS